MRKAISLMLVCSILLLTGNIYAEEKKKGAAITIEKTYGGKVEGELIAVKENALLRKIRFGDPKNSGEPPKESKSQKSKIMGRMMKPFNAQTQRWFLSEKYKTDVLYDPFDRRKYFRFRGDSTRRQYRNRILKNIPLTTHYFYKGHKVWV